MAQAQTLSQSGPQGLTQSLGRSGSGTIPALAPGQDLEETYKVQGLSGGMAVNTE